MTHAEPANPERRSDEAILADLDAIDNTSGGLVYRTGGPRLETFRLARDVAPLLAALAAARSDTDRLGARLADAERDADQLRTENEQLRRAILGNVDTHQQLSTDLAAARVEVDTLRAKIEAVIVAARGWKTCGEHTGIASNRCMLPPNHRGHHDCQIVPGDATYLDELLAGAVPGSPETHQEPPSAPTTGPSNGPASVRAEGPGGSPETRQEEQR